MHWVTPFIVYEAIQPPAKSHIVDPDASQLRQPVIQPTQHTDAKFYSISLEAIKNWTCHWEYVTYPSRWMRWSHGCIRLSTRYIDRCSHLGLSTTGSLSHTLHKQNKTLYFSSCSLTFTHLLAFNDLLKKVTWLFTTNETRKIQMQTTNQMRRISTYADTENRSTNRLRHTCHIWKHRW